MKVTYTSRIKNYVRDKTGLMKTSDIAKLDDKKLIELLTHSSPGSDREKIVLQAIISKIENSINLDQTQTFKTNFGGSQTYTLMTAAAKYGHTDVVDLLKANGVNPAKSMRTNSKGLTSSAQEYLKINEKKGGPPRRQYYNSEKAAIAFVGTAAVGGAGAAIFFTGGAAAIPIFFTATAPSLATTGFAWTAGTVMAGYAGAAGLVGTGIAGAAGLAVTGYAGAAGLAMAGYAGAAGVVTTIGTALGIAGTIAVDILAGMSAATGVTYLAAGTYALMKKVKNKFTKSPQANQDKVAPDEPVKLTPNYNGKTGITTYADSKGQSFLESSSKDGKAIFNPNIAPGMKVVIPSPRTENGKPIIPPQYDVIELDHNGKLLATRVIPPLAFGEKPRGESSIDQQWLAKKLAESDLPGSTKTRILGTVIDASDQGRTTTPRGTVTSVNEPVQNQAPDTSYKFKAEDFSVSFNSHQLTIGKQALSGALIYEAGNAVKVKPMISKAGDGIEFAILPPNTMQVDEKIEIKHARMNGDRPCSPPQFDIIELDSKGKLIGVKIDPPLVEGEKERGTSVISKSWLSRLEASDQGVVRANPQGIITFVDSPIAEVVVPQPKAPEAEIALRFSGGKESPLAAAGDGIYKSIDMYKTAVKAEVLDDGVKFVVSPANNMFASDVIAVKQARMDGNQPCDPPQFDLIKLDSKGRLWGAEVVSAAGEVEDARGTSAVSQKWLNHLKKNQPTLETREEEKKATLKANEEKMAAFKAKTPVEQGGSVNAAPATGVNPGGDVGVRR